MARTLQQRKDEVRKVLLDQRWKGAKSLSAIARHCKVSKALVSVVMKELGIRPENGSVFYVTRWGTTAFMDARNVGRRPTAVRVERAVNSLGRILRRYRAIGLAKNLQPYFDAHRQMEEVVKAKKRKAS